MRFLASAGKHGVGVADIAHALRVPVRLVELDDATTLVLGPDRTGRWLEVVVADLDGEDPRVIHAMALRARFRAYLPGGEQS